MDDNCYDLVDILAESGNESKQIWLLPNGSK